MIRLKRIDFMCKRKLLLVILLAFFLSMFIAANVSAEMFWKDYNGDAPGGYMPDIDQNQAFKKIRTEETDGSVSLSGTWGTSLDSSASGGSLAHTNDPSASCTFSFTGSSISWIGAKAFNRGQANVYIDDIEVATVSQYDDDVLWQQVIYSDSSLSSGPHTIKIEPIDAPGLFIDVDAFAVGDTDHYCAPVAEANSLWWLDKAHGLGIFESPYDGTGYIGGDINVDGANDVLDLVQDLAVLMKTNVGHTGTTVEDEQAGINAFLAKYHPQLNLKKKLYVHTQYKPEFSFIEAEVERSQDVKLDIGFWKILECEGEAGGDEATILWQRVGGHAVTVAGVDSENSLLAISDPDNDAAENEAPGVVRPVPVGHPAHPSDPSVHNNEANASHDIYTVVPSASPGGLWALEDYPGWANFPLLEWGQPTLTSWPSGFSPCNDSIILTEIEAAVVVSPLLTVLSPNGGEKVGPGSTYPITWQAPPGIQTFDLKYSMDNGTNWTNIKTGLNSQNSVYFSYNWKVPAPVQTKTKCLVKVIGHSLNSTMEDQSDGAFTIEAVVKLTSPNGGEELTSGSWHNIMWKTGTVISVRKTILSYYDGSAWQPIKTLLGNPGSFLWKIPDTTSDSCKVKVVLKGADGVVIGKDTSDKTFSIVAAP